MSYLKIRKSQEFGVTTFPDDALVALGRVGLVVVGHGDGPYSCKSGDRDVQTDARWMEADGTREQSPCNECVVRRSGVWTIKVKSVSERRKNILQAVTEAFNLSHTWSVNE